MNYLKIIVSIICLINIFLAVFCYKEARFDEAAFWMAFAALCGTRV